MASSDRYFPATILGGHLHVRGIPDRGPWDPARLEWDDEAFVDILLSKDPGHRKARTREELEAIMKEPKRVRPSVTFGSRGEWGSVGMESPARQVVPYYSAKPVRLAVFEPPSGPVHDLYRRYLPVDLASPQFRCLFLEELQSDARFANKFVPPEANYGWGKGAQVIAALASDPALRDVHLDIDTVRQLRKVRCSGTPPAVPVLRLWLALRLGVRKTRLP